MGHNIGPYAYGISHTRMGRPIRVWANIRIWGRTYIPYNNVAVIACKLACKANPLDTEQFSSVLYYEVNDVFKIFECWHIDLCTTSSYTDNLYHS